MTSAVLPVVGAAGAQPAGQHATERIVPRDGYDRCAPHHRSRIEREGKGRAKCSPSVNARQASRRRSDAAADSSRRVVERPRRGRCDHVRKPICRHALHAAGSARRACVADGHAETLTRSWTCAWRSEIDLSVSGPPPGRSKGWGGRAQKTKTLWYSDRYVPETVETHLI